MAKRASAVPPKKVTREDLERGFRGLQGDVKEKVDKQRSKLVMAAAGGGVLVVLLVFLFGRRSGKKKNTYVEIRRV
ncbi:MAG: hypothetical protein ACRDZ2_04905 [Ilumatobacteraceae bacterium]